MNRREAQNYFGATAPAHFDEAASELEATLREKSIAAVNLGLDPNAFQELSDQYAVCIEEYPKQLGETSWNFDADGVPEDGHVRKEIKFNDADMQISDPKNLFHFNNDLLERMHGMNLIKEGPRELRDFLEHGIDLHRSLALKAKSLIEILDQSYDRMGELYFPVSHPLGDVTFRLLRYDGYSLYDEDGRQVAENNEQIAKAHYDRGGMTIQAYASAPGFWIHPEPNDGSRRKPTTIADKQYPPHGSGESQVFFGVEHKAIYGSHDPIKSLYHGVDRIIDTSDMNRKYMPPRTAAIAFVDAPRVDVRITSKDTQPDRVDQDKLNI